VDPGYAGLAGAMSAAIEGAFRLDTVANDLTVTMLALWGERVDGAFEAVKVVGLTQDNNFQRFIVLVSANFTFMPHTRLLLY
jgi:hypothetical protein